MPNGKFKTKQWHKFHDMQIYWQTGNNSDNYPFHIMKYYSFHMNLTLKELNSTFKKI